MVGTPYSSVARLIGVAAEHWDAIDGEAASRGVDLFELPPDRFLNAIYWWAVQRVKEPEDFKRRLEQHFPLPMEWAVGAPVTEQDLNADGESFVAFAAAFGVPLPKSG